MHTNCLLTYVVPRKIQSEGPIFYRTESEHQTDFFIADKKWDLPYDFASGCLLAHTAGIYRSYCAEAMAGEVPLLDCVTLIFHWTEVSAHRPIFYHKQIVGRKGPIFLEQKSAHMNRFSLRFFVCDKNLVRVHWPLSVTVDTVMLHFTGLWCRPMITCYET